MEYVFSMNGGTIIWKSSKQSVFTMSTIELEYIGASDAAKEVGSKEKFFVDLDVQPSIQKPIEIPCDNTSVIALAKEPMSHNSTKYISREQGIPLYT